MQRSILPDPYIGLSTARVILRPTFENLKVVPDFQYSVFTCLKSMRKGIPHRCSQAEASKHFKIYF